MIHKLKAFWASLPHQKQALVVTFASAAGLSLAHAFEDAGGIACLTWGCFGHILALVFSPHMLLTAILAGAGALKVFYMLPNRAAPSQQN